MNGYALEILKKNAERMDKVALVDRNATRKITWESLLDKICRVAAYARKEGFKGIIPVCMERGMEATATLMGLNLAGVGAAPLSIKTPKGRIDNISSQTGNDAWTIDTFEKACKCNPAYELCSEGEEADPAYVVFTSGSTGSPKGVMLPNKAVLGGMLRAAGPDFYDFNENDRMIQSASMSFVAFVQEVFAPLYSGVLVYFLPEEGRGDLHVIEDFINKNGITCMFISPQMYRNFKSGPSMRCVAMGGEKIVYLGPKNHRLVSVYGMSEAAGYAVHYDITEPLEHTPLGSPCSDIRTYIVDEDGNEADEGEMCMSGGIASGYLGLEELSKKTFTKNPFTDDPEHSVLLHSGDIVRKLPNGEIIFVSRKDNMIKINSQRVEPGEIEKVFEDYPGVDQAVAKGFTDEWQHSIICGYYTSKHEIDENDLKKYLGEKLPRYMVPSVLVKMEEMPVNANGKLDRTALEMPDLSQFLSEYETPKTETERLICQAFEEVLDLEKIGRNDDFFNIGGDSITAIDLVDALVDLGISTGDIFAGRSPAGIALLIDSELNDVYENIPTEINKTKLTDSQLGILLECGLNEESTKYNVPVHFSFDRKPEMTCDFIKNTVNVVIKNHPALYSAITEESGEFYMTRCPFPEDGLCNAFESSDESIVEKYINETSSAIAIGRDPLCIVNAILLKDTVHILMNMHHIVSDGSSVAVIKNQLSKVLAGCELPPETIDAFSLYEIEQRIKTSKARKDAQTYYEHLLCEAEIDSNLLPDHKASEEGAPGKAKTFNIPQDKIQTFINNNGFTENTFFMGVYGYVLAKMTGQSASLFGVAENGRSVSSLGDTVSMLVKTLPVVLRIDEEKTSVDLLSDLQAQFFSTMRNDAVGFNELAKDYGIRSDVMFVYQSEMLSGTDEIDMCILDNKDTLSNISLMVMKQEETYSLRFEYRLDMYEESTVDRFINLYKECAESFTTDIKLKEIELISAEDKAFLDRENTSIIYQISHESVIDLFKKSVEKFGDKTAIISNGQSYTYSQVDEISDRIASYLVQQGVGKGDVVSILIPRCEYMIIASLGVIKSGAAYQPLDPSYPEERLKFMVEDANASFVIKDRNLNDILKDFKGEILYTDEIADLPNCETKLPSPSPDDLFVLLYTSGTTGTPKGVMLSHRNVSCFVQVEAEIRELKEDSIVSQYASFGFDAHIHEIYPPIVKGCTIAIIPEEIRLDLAGIKDYVEEVGITHLFMTTQVARQFIMAYPHVKGLEYLDTAGEKLVSFEPKNDYKILNLYGPSEGTVCSTAFFVDKYYDNIPIGKAHYNYRVYIVDDYGRRVPIGVPGELVQSGAQVAVGYLGRPELTEKSFVQNTYEDNVPDDYQRCYKTGDIVRFIDDGNIEYIGRRDHQVKIRGFRIELGEVEKAILDYDKIKSVAVVAFDSGTGKSLCAYVVSDEKINVSDLNAFIAQSHPPYMVPAITMQIDSIPLNVNGKVDKRKLPKPELTLGDDTKPENETQQKIFECVAEALGIDEFGINTDIFMAGLSSIGSIRLCTLLDEKFGVPVKIRDLNRCQTVIGLEKFLCGNEDEDVAETQESKEIADSKNEYGESHPITKTMEGIFAECLQHPDSTIYNIPYMLKLGDAIDEGRLKDAIVSAVEAHPCMKVELFTDEDGKICQHRRLNDTFTIDEIKEISLDSASEINSNLVRPFELIGERLFEISIIHAGGTYLLINIHHIISDGTSMSIFVNDIQSAYEGKKLQIEKYNSFDIAEEEKRSRTKEEIKREKNYYESLLEGTNKDFLLLPDKQEDVPASSGTLKLTQRSADADLIKAYCEKMRLSMNSFFISAFGFVLAKYFGSDYSVFNTIYNGRNDSRTNDTVGMLVKTLPVVCYIDKEKVEEVTKDMASQLLKSMSNDLYSYAEICKNFEVKNDVMFIFQGDGFEIESFCGMPVEEIPLSLSEAKAPLAMQVVIKDGVINYELEYDPSKFTEELVKAFLLSFDQVSAEFIKKDLLKDISLLSKDEEEKMEKYNDTEYPYDKTETIVSMFLDRLASQPEDICVEYKGKTLTYAEVGQLTTKLSYFLMCEGIGRGDTVAILINRDENMVISAHGAVRAGAAYLGLDPTYPPERIDFMIKDSGAKYLIADRTLTDVLCDYSGKIIYTDEIEGLKMPTDAELQEFMKEERHQISPEDNAVIVYSSGTTGLPKGSILRHRNIVCFYHNYVLDAYLERGARVATYASFGFDGGAMDVFCSPMSGSSLYIVPDDIRLDLRMLEQFFIKNEITAGFMTTQVGCRFIAGTKCRTLRSFLVGGERFIPVVGPDWVNFRNGYGPSETMCYVNLFNVRNTGKLQPIGKVSRNTKEYIIDKYGNRLPYGACGEFCIAGGQVGAGYLNRPEKTAETFVKNPFSEDPEYDVMYKTGDVVRMLPDGNYDFVGRNDGQVKIRGFRIELSEIEGQIRKYPGVTSTVVSTCDNPSGGKFLAAYVVMDEKLDSDAIKKFIGEEKPDYMIPTVIMQIDEIPLTSNGKVDMRKLPKPELGSFRKGIEPSNEIEEKLCTIFEEVIGIDKVYADDDFFNIGGSSISAIEVVVKCEQAGYPVVYKNLFVNSTPQKLAEFIMVGEEKDVSAADFNKNDEYDYSALKYNVIGNLSNIRNDGVGDVLLTGVTGFLGSHVLCELIESTSAQVICLVRSKEDLSADIRFEMMMTYYFEDWYNEKIKDRIVVIDGELEDEATKEKLEGYHFDTIINCAANVKHFAVETELMTSNFSGVENLIELAEKTGAKLIQISSLSVCGESVNGSVPSSYVFNETDLNVGQSLENKYVYTKYLAEQAVIDAISRKKIHGKIIRLGNLMARNDDNLFQLNANQNALLRMFLGFVELGCYPVNMLDAEIEFSPIDSVAKAVVLLSGTPDEFTVFHAKNCNAIHYGYLLMAIAESGYPIEVVEDNVFEERLQKALENTENIEKLGGLLSYRNSTKEKMVSATKHAGDSGIDTESETRVKIATSVTFTTKALYRLGFGWPLISMKYLKDMVKILIDLDFFDA